MRSSSSSIGDIFVTVAVSSHRECKLASPRQRYLSSTSLRGDNVIYSPFVGKINRTSQENIEPNKIVNLATIDTPGKRLREPGAFGEYLVKKYIFFFFSVLEYLLPGGCAFLAKSHCACRRTLHVDDSELIARLQIWR